MSITIEHSMTNRKVFEALDIARSATIQLFTERAASMTFDRKNDPYVRGQMDGLMSAHIILKELLKAVNSMGTIDDWDELKNRLEETSEEVTGSIVEAFTASDRGENKFQLSRNESGK